MSRSSNEAGRPGGQPSNRSCRPDERDVKAPPSAGEEREPAALRAQAPNPSTTKRSLATREKKSKYPIQELLQWEIWCAKHQMDFQEMAAQAIREFMERNAVARNLSSGLAAQRPSGPRIDLDLIDDDDKNIDLSSSD